jgi:hydrocephalus-inducing protein
MFSPALGTVPVGSAVEVNVVFKAEGAASFLETLGIDITDRDFNDQPEGIPYEVTAESCIPGIVTEDTVGIFEEHNICSSLDPFLPINFQYATRDNVFNFGAVIADLSSLTSSIDCCGGGGGSQGR